MKVSFIGCGNMAKAIITGILNSEVLKPDQMMASAKTAATRERIPRDPGILQGTNREAASFADVIFLAVKPQFYEEVIREIRDCVSQDQVIVSMAPGKTLDWLREQFGYPLKLVRIMPNTPAMVKAGMTGICAGDDVTKEQLDFVKSLCDSFGRSCFVPEHLLDVVTSVSGSSPAYVFMMIEAMADGAVADGMPRSMAYEFAAQAVLGSAKMVLETGKHPGELKDMVCSPGGTTIEAVRVLEAKGFRSSLIEAMKACTGKSRGM